MKTFTKTTIGLLLTISAAFMLSGCQGEFLGRAGGDVDMYEYTTTTKNGKTATCIVFDGIDSVAASCTWENDKDN